MDKVWNELLVFETLDLVKRHVRAKQGKNLSTTRALQISSNFIQGREYFKSAERANITVRPLLQYYGVMSLSKGLILMLNNMSLTENQLKHSHGLEVKNWKETLASKNFEDLLIVVRRGTFTELLDATRNVNFLKHNSSKADYITPLSKPHQGYELVFKDVMQYFPDLHKEYELWLDKELVFAKLIELYFHAGDNKVLVHLEGEISQDNLGLLFPEKYCGQLEMISRNRKETLFKYDRNGWCPNIAQSSISFLDIGTCCVVPVLKNDIGFNLLTSMYLISYVLGMMARYFPTTWISLMRAEKGDKIYPFICRALDYIYDIYPKQILIFLNSMESIVKL